MSNIDNKFTIEELIYYAFFSIMLFAKGIGLYSGQWPYTFVLIVAFILFLIKVVMSKHSLLELIVIVLITILGITVYRSSGEIGVLVIIVTVLGMKGVSVKRTMILGCVVWTATFLLQIIVSLLGFREDIFRVQSKLGLGYIIRWALGQPHPNVLQISSILLSVFLLYVLNVKRKKLIVASVGLLFFNMYIFLYSVSYTGIILAILYIFVNLYFSFTQDRDFYLVEKIVMIMIIPVSAAFSIFGPIYFTGELWNICNKILNTRFYIAKSYMELNPVSLFGSGYCDQLYPSLNNLDCSYVFVLMHYGIIFFVLFFCGYELLVVYLIKNKKKKELGIVLSLAIAAISEPFFVNTSFKNISLIFLGAFFYDSMSKCVKVDVLNKVLFQNYMINTRIFYIDIDRIYDNFKEYVNEVCSHKKIYVWTGLIVGIGLSVCYICVFDIPSSYYVKRDWVQIQEEYGVLIDINNLPQDFNGKILQYEGNMTPMLEIKGNAMLLEYIRGGISTFLWGTVISILIISMVYFICGKKHGKSKLKKKSI